MLQFHVENRKSFVMNSRNSNRDAAEDFLFFENKCMAVKKISVPYVNGQRENSRMF